MTTPIDDPVPAEPAGAPSSSYRLAWTLTTTGIAIMLLVCLVLILIAGLRR